MLTSAKIKEQKVFFVHFRKLLKVMSMQSFRFIRLVDKRSTFFLGGGGGGVGMGERRGEFYPLHETNVHEKAHEE